MSKFRINEIPRFWAENTVPVLFSTAVMSSVSYIYAAGSGTAILLFTLAAAVYSLLIFALYELMRKLGKAWVATIAVIVMFFIISTFSLRLVDFRNPMELSIWFMEPSRYTRVRYGSSFALILMFGFILISCLYYFTRIRYRKVFLFLICLCPFCLFAKTFTVIPVIYPIILMTLFFFIMTGNTGRADIAGTSAASDIRTGGSTAASSMAFVLAVTILASFLPKAEFSPFREAFDEFVTGVTISAAEAADFSDFSDSSSNATSDDDDTVIFMFYGANPYLIKRQCFNIYDLADNTWGYYGDANSGSSNWSRYMDYEDPTAFYDAAGYDGGTVNRMTCWVRSTSGGMRAIYTAENPVGLSLYNSDAKIYRTENDEYFLDKDDARNIQSYQMLWAEFEPEAEFTRLFTDELAQGISEGGDDAAVYAENYLKAKEQAVKYNDVLLAEDMRDSCFSSSAARERVKQLAESVTAQALTDLDKARALEQYFHNGEYIYDIDFTADDASPDNFIFNTKRGACAAYATAMTLMCRELEMTARYCEGFLVQRQQNNGAYWYVTTADSHAFVQVWIDGYGWTSFDPTSNKVDGGYFDLTFIYVGIAALVIIIVGAAAIFLRPRIIEGRYIRRIKAARGAKQKSLIYTKINSMINGYIRSRENLLTPADTAEKCAELFGYDISDFTEKYENAVYGGIGDENEDLSDVYAGFAEAYRAKLKEERKNKKK